MQCDDTELNQWASLKRAIQIKPIKDEINEVKVYKEKKNREDLKKKILKSFYEPTDAKDEEEMSEDGGLKNMEMNGKDKPQKEEMTEEKASKSLKTNFSVKKQEKQTRAPEKDKSHAPINTKDKRNSSKHSSNKTKSAKKKKNKNVLQSMTDERLSAYGINPKKFHKKLKYANKNPEGLKNEKLQMT